MLISKAITILLDMLTIAAYVMCFLTLLLLCVRFGKVGKKTPSTCGEIQSLTELVTVAQLWLDNHCLGEGFSKWSDVIWLILKHCSHLCLVPSFIQSRHWT